MVTELSNGNPEIPPDVVIGINVVLIFLLPGVDE
jgi:hypothetical protein